MDLWSAPAEDVRPLLTRERHDLLSLIATLSPQEWTSPSAALGWTVKDLALHVLDDDLGWLSRGRDDDQSGLLDMSDHASFVDALAAKNQRWVDGANGLSLPVVIGLLRWAGDEVDAYYAGIDLYDEGSVSWASDGPVPQWFDLAQDLTERWVHQMQMREAVARVEDYAATYLPVVLRTFVWALPHQFTAAAPIGTEVGVDLSVGGTWSLTSQGSGTWTLAARRADRPVVGARFSDDAGWRWLTGAAVPTGTWSAEGPPDLVAALMGVRGIIV